MLLTLFRALAVADGLEVKVTVFEFVSRAVDDTVVVHVFVLLRVQVPVAVLVKEPGGVKCIEAVSLPENTALDDIVSLDAAENDAVLDEDTPMCSEAVPSRASVLLKEASELLD